MSHLLEVKNLDVKFDTDEGRITAVENISLSVDQGEVLGIVGESGCGKSTTARSIVQLPKPTSGSVMVTSEGDSIELTGLKGDALRKVRPKLQMIFQDPFSSLNPRMNLLDLVGEPMLVNGLKNRKERSERVAELLRLVGLRPEYMQRFPHAFSGGQRQRISIARALATRPRLLICCLLYTSPSPRD